MMRTIQTPAIAVAVLLGGCAGSTPKAVSFASLRVPAQDGNQASSDYTPWSCGRKTSLYMVQSRVTRLNEDAARAVSEMERSLTIPNMPNCEWLSYWHGGVARKDAIFRATRWVDEGRLARLVERLKEIGTPVYVEEFPGRGTVARNIVDEFEAAQARLKSEAAALANDPLERRILTDTVRDLKADVESYRASEGRVLVQVFLFQDGASRLSEEAEERAHPALETSKVDFQNSSYIATVNGLAFPDAAARKSALERLAVFAKEAHGRRESIGGVGFAFEPDPGRGTIRVKSVIAGMPADRAGVKAGDEFISANGHAFQGLEAAAIAARITGNAGTTVELRFPEQACRTPAACTLTLKRELLFPSHAAAEEALRKVLKDSHPLVRARALDILWDNEWLRESDVPILKKMLREPRLPLRDSARRALQDAFGRTRRPL